MSQKVKAVYLRSSSSKFSSCSAESLFGYSDPSGKHIAEFHMVVKQSMECGP